MKYKATKIAGLKVEVVNDQVDKALRKFKKKVAESGLMQQLREREFYEKPTTARKKAKSQAVMRWKRKIQSESLPKKMF